MDNLELIEKHIVAGKPLEFIRNCISCCEVDFDYICAGGYVEICKFMIEAGSKSVYSRIGYALHLASGRGHLEVVNELLKAGADIHYDDEAALRHASENGHLEVVRCLLESGANIHAENDYAFRFASYNGNLEIVKFLLESGANVHAVDDYSLKENSSLRWARENGHTEVVEFLEDWIESNG